MEVDGERAHDAVLHERASLLHEAAALLHERAASLQSQHAEEMRVIGDATRGRRAEDLALVELQLAAAAYLRAVEEREQAAVAASRDES